MGFVHRVKAGKAVARADQQLALYLPGRERRAAMRDLHEQLRASDDVDIDAFVRKHTEGRPKRARIGQGIVAAALVVGAVVVYDHIRLDARVGSDDLAHVTSHPVPWVRLLGVALVVYVLVARAWRAYRPTTAVGGPRLGADAPRRHRIARAIAVTANLALPALVAGLVLTFAIYEVEWRWSLRATTVPLHRVAPQAWSGFPRATQPAVDVDRDGRPDLLLYGINDHMYSGAEPFLAWQTAHRRFTVGPRARIMSEPVTDPAAPRAGTAHRRPVTTIAVADLNGDGQPDLVQSTNLPHQLLVRKLQPSGTWNSPQPLAVWDTSGRVASDLSSLMVDGERVRVAGAPLTDVVWGSAGSFDGIVMAAAIGRPGAPYRREDRRLVLFRPFHGGLRAVSAIRHGFGYAYSFGSGSFPAVVSPTGPLIRTAGGREISTRSLGGYSYRIADVTGDRIEDLVYVSRAGELRVRVGQRGGDLDAARTIFASVLDTGSDWSIDVGDLDGDGRPDLLIGTDVGIPHSTGRHRHPRRRLWVLRARKDGSFERRGDALELPRRTYVDSIQDLDGDHRGDLIVSGASPASTYVAWGRGDGTFE